MVSTSLAEVVLQQTATILEALKYLQVPAEGDSQDARNIVLRAAVEMQMMAERRATASDAAALRELAKKNVQAVIMPEVPRARKTA